MAERTQSKRRQGLFGPGISLGRVAGVEIQVDWSLIIIFTLISVNLGLGVFPQWHPNWSAALRWAIAVLAAILLFVSVLIHELSHALVGKIYGLKVERITLFLFGGMAHMGGESPHARAELLIAGVGPLTSLVVGVLATMAGVALGGAPLQAADDPMAGFRTLGPVATLLLWLGPINILLALFNLVPGFPLDGGRVLRALLWWLTGSLHKATQWASWVGRGFGWLLITTGVLMAFGVPVPVFGTGLLGGFWLILIGWFLSNAARASFQQLVMREALEHIPVRRVMRSAFEGIAAQTDLDSLVHEHIMQSDQRCFPVLEGERFLGLVCLDDVRRVPRDEWQRTEARIIMTPADELASVAPDDDAMDAMDALVQRGFDQLPVVEHGRLRGLVRRQDIMKWLSLRSDPHRA